MEKAKGWIETHPDIWEFIKFNILSNCATVTNFIVLWISTSFLFVGFADRTCNILPLPFGENAYLFSYPAASDGGSGLCGFLGFLLAYICAQIVNYLVQRKLVFKAENDISKTIGWYIGTVVVVGIICQIVGGYGTNFFVSLGVSKGLAPILTNIVNILIQVVINYPMMKFVIMKK